MKFATDQPGYSHGMEWMLRSGWLVLVVFIFLAGLAVNIKLYDLYNTLVGEESVNFTVNE